MSIASLTQLFTPAGLFLDADGDGLPDGLRVRLSAGLNPGAIDVAARLGLESCALSLGFTAPHAEGIPIWFGPANPECPSRSSAGGQRRKGGCSGPLGASGPIACSTRPGSR